MDSKVKIAVVYHSGYGHTAKVAEAVGRGVTEVGNADLVMVKVEEVDKYWEELDASDAIIMGAPTYMGSLSAQFKTFMDASSRIRYREKRWANKLAAGFTNAASRSGDKLSSLMQLILFAGQHHMNWVNLGLPPGHNATYTTEDVLNRHSFWIGVGTQADIDSPPEVAPPPADLKTAEFLGARVTQLAREVKVGRQSLSSVAK